MLCVWNDKYVMKVYRHMEMLGIANIKVTLGKRERETHSNDHKKNVMYNFSA